MSNQNRQKLIQIQEEKTQTVDKRVSDPIMINISDNENKLQTVILHQEKNIDELMEEENERDTKELLRKSVIIHEISQDLSTLIEGQGEILDEADNNIEESVQHAEDATTDIGKAKKSFFASRLLSGTIISTVVGLAGGGLVGGVIGYATGAGITGAGIAGAVVGSGTCGGITYGSMKGKVKE